MLDGPKRVVVLQSTRPPDGTTRYIDQVVTHARPNIEFKYIDLRSLFGRVDVFHVHWPEVLVRGSGRLQTWIRVMVFRVALRCMLWRKTAILRTVHNLEPHEPGSRTEQRFLARLDELTTLRVAINPVTKVADPSVVILHGHYRDRFQAMPKDEPVQGRVLYAGLIRPYKGIERLLDVFSGVRHQGAHLRLAGKATPELRDIIEVRVAADPRVSAKFGFLPDPDFVREITRSEVVCLPYEELHNSGMLLVALSLDRPVIAPSTPTTRALAAEVGEPWMHLYEGSLNAGVIDAALAQRVRSNDHAARPNLEGRDWEIVGAAYSDAYEKAVRLKRQR